MNTKRMRSRFHRSGNSSSRHQNGQVPLNRNHVFDSNGPDVRIRGTAQQLFEKYLQHGRDAVSSGDRISAESFFQYADHYSRILNLMNQANQARHRNQPIAPVEETTLDNTSEPVVAEERAADEAETENSKRQETITIEEEPKPVSRPGRRGRPARISVEISEKE